MYGLKAVRKFLNNNQLVSIIRAHEPPQDGVDFHYFGENSKSFPSVITVFSAPDYPMDSPDKMTYENRGAAIFLEQGKQLIVEKFTHCKRPF